MEPQVTQLASREVWLAWWSSFPTGIIQMSARKKGCVCGGGVLPIAGGQLFRRISFEFKRVPAGKWGQSLGKKALGLLRQECSGEEEEGG